MAKTPDWDSRIGRRVTLRDLHILFAVVQHRSMAKAGAYLGRSQSAVSQAVAAIEQAVGARLLDRTSRGVEPTAYGSALLRRGRVAFDELRQGIRDIEFLADPTTGELTIGYTQSDTMLARVIEQFSEKYPRVVMRANIVPTPSFKFPGLRDRTYDVILTRIPTPIPKDDGANDLNVEALFEDPFVIVASMNSQWARRRRVDLAELLDEPWLIPPRDTPSYEVVADAFKIRGLQMPKATLETYSMELRAKLSAHGRFITVVPLSVLRQGKDRPGLKELPVDIPMRTSPVGILTLKNRTLSPVVERFIECTREVAKSMATNNGRQKK